MTKLTFAIRTFAAASIASFMCIGNPVFAQQIQVPSLQVCNATALSSNAFVIIDTRAGTPYTGFFSLRGNLSCNPAAATPYPTGALGIYGISMNDSTIQGDVIFTTFQQVTSGGKYTPTIWVSGRCKAANVKGCNYWLMAVDNVPGQVVGRTYDVISFLILDQNGKRVAYGTGNVVDGDLKISSAN